MTTTNPFGETATEENHDKDKPELSPLSDKEDETPGKPVEGPRCAFCKEPFVVGDWVRGVNSGFFHDRCHEELEARKERQTPARFTLPMGTRLSDEAMKAIAPRVGRSDIEFVDYDEASNLSCQWNYYPKSPTNGQSLIDRTGYWERAR
jgi:hypothetical protein